MRAPGGNTPDLLAIALDEDFYRIYADVMMNDFTDAELHRQHYIAMSASRKRRYNYVHSAQEVLDRYGDKIREYVHYPDGIADAMGNEAFFGRFLNMEDALEFQNYIQEKY